MYKISLSEINLLLDKISRLQRLYLPAETEKGRGEYVLYGDGTEYAQNITNTVRSPKDFFFPQTENIAEFKIQGKSIEVKESEALEDDFAVFGVRACDVKSFDILDRVFLSEPSDPYYKSKREHCTIISRACGSWDETCFCTAFGIEPWMPEGDVTLWTDDNFMYWSDNTEKGKSLTEKLNGILISCGNNTIEETVENIKSVFEKLPIKDINLEYWKNTDEKEIFGSAVWDEIYTGCLGCGTCTFVCPTCQCYDIRDFDTGNGVRRFRCWDSCMYSDFTKMAHGNPRKTQKERFRQRFMHKLKYFPENNGGVFSCVGCGRCLKSCPQSINIVKVSRSMGNE
ncbi:MAG: 4Fe-4S dicluster domain-containing protein [Clostridiales bacterium]|nr:4Fe-4S dicluster domain-containing protein [Clostridiales bacterium]